MQGCGVRISPTAKSCVITVWLGGKRSFETIGRVTPDTPYEYLRELAVKRIGDLKRRRLPRAPLRQTLVPNTDTLRDVLAGYIAAHPQLRANTIKQYQGCLNRGFSAQMDQPVALLVTEEILRLNREHLEALTKKDRLHKPPIGFYGWQTDLRSLRAVLGWYAATKNRPSAWPDRKALKISSPPARRLPVELQTLKVGGD